MALLDAFTGDAYKEAAAKQRDYLNGIMQGIMQRTAGAQATGLGALTSGQEQGLGALRSGVGQARTDISDTAIRDAIAQLTGYGGRAEAALTGAEPRALAELRSGVEAAKGAYDPLMAAGGRYGALGGGAGEMIAKALGLQGPEGNAAATGAFQAGPGYRFALEQGLESVLRNANAAGMPAGGNQLRASQTFGQGLANQEYQNWLGNLMKQAGLYSPLESSALGIGGAGIANAALTGGTGGANIITGTGGRLADLLSATGRGAADITAGGGRSLADLASRGGLAEADIYGKTGQSIADLVSRLMLGSNQQIGQLAPGYASTFGAEAAADTAASNNIWNALGSGLKFVAGGGIGNLSSGLKQAGSLFG